MKYGIIVGVSRMSKYLSTQSQSYIMLALYGACFEVIYKMVCFIANYLDFDEDFNIESYERVGCTRHCIAL